MEEKVRERFAASRRPKGVHKNSSKHGLHQIKIKRINYQPVERNSRNTRFTKSGIVHVAPYVEDEVHLSFMCEAVVKHYTKTVLKVPGEEKGWTVNFVRSLDGPVIDTMELLPKTFYTSSESKPLYAEFLRVQVVKEEPDLEATPKPKPSVTATISTSSASSLFSETNPELYSAIGPVSVSTYIPRRQSKVSREAIMKAGGVVSCTKREKVVLETFDIVKTSWDSNPRMHGDLVIDEHIFSAGGFRDVWKANLVLDKDPEKIIPVVIKDYNDAGIPKVEDFYDETKESLDWAMAVRREVQLNDSVVAMADDFNQLVFEHGDDPLRIKYNKVLYCSFVNSNRQPVFLENYLEGKPWKALTNAGKDEITLGRPSDDVMEVCRAFAHYSLLFSCGEFAVLDLQGVGHTYMDPAVCTSKSIDPGSLMFGPANGTESGIKNFMWDHDTKCNRYCELMKKAFNKGKT